MFILSKTYKLDNFIVIFNDTFKLSKISEL